MADLSSKKTIRRARRPAANASLIEGPLGGSMENGDSTCGHSSCSGSACNVRYMGPTSHVRDHHIMHAAHGASQVWTAAIVAGLAVVLTGAMAYTSVNAQSVGKDDPVNNTVTTALMRISKRLENVEGMVKRLSDQCVVAPGRSGEAREAAGSGSIDPKLKVDPNKIPATVGGAGTTDSGTLNPKLNVDPNKVPDRAPSTGNTFDITECREKCSSSYLQCLKNVSGDSAGTQRCKGELTTCLQRCSAK